MGREKVRKDVSRASNVSSRGVTKAGRPGATKVTSGRQQAPATRTIQSPSPRYLKANSEESLVGHNAAKLISNLGWSRDEAVQIRASLLSFEEDWNAPGMDCYDRL